MELLLGAVTAILVEIAKRLSNKFGKKWTKRMIVIAVFILVFIWTFLTQANYISKEAVAFAMSVLGASITTYELVIKTVLRLVKW